ncbi:MAG: hemolysin family protein [Anaerolineae bacterium]
MEVLTVPAVLLRLLVIFLLILANGYFTAMEFALVAVRRTRIAQLSAEGNRSAQLVGRLLDNPDRFIAASQLGITMASLALGWVGESTMAAIIEPPLRLLVGRWSVAVANTAGTIAAFALITYLHIVLGEQVPKGVALRSAERTSLVAAPLMDIFFRVFRPFIVLLDSSAHVVLRWLGAGLPAGHRVAMTVEELRMVIEESQKEGLLGAELEDMVQRVLRFGDRLVREVMIPRTEVLAVEKGATLGQVLRLFVDSRHARFPVYEGNLDNIVGIIAMKDVLAAVALGESDRSSSIEPLIRPAFCIPETRKVGTLFSEMRERHIQMAVVLDEYGGTAGIVTLEMLTEEIMGEISEEWSVSEPALEPLGSHTFRVNAQRRIEEVNDDLGLNLPESEDYETLAGFILYHLQAIPTVGQVFRYQDAEFTIVEMEGLRIETVEITTRAGGSLPANPTKSLGE